MCGDKMASNWETHGACMHAKTQLFFQHRNTSADKDPAGKGGDQLPGPPEDPQDQ